MKPLRFDLKRPCDDCPFRRKGGIRLTVARVVQIGRTVTTQGGGAPFPCHKTTGVLGNRRAAQLQHCAGALILARKLGVETQIVQVASRLGYARPMEGLQDEADVFDTLDEMIEAQSEG